MISTSTKMHGLVFAVYVYRRVARMGEGMNKDLCKYVRCMIRG